VRSALAIAAVALATPAFASVTITSSAMPSTAAIGGKVIYRIQATRTAGETSLVLTDKPPANHRLLSVAVNGGATVDCTQPPASGTLVNGITATCSNATGDLQINVADMPTIGISTPPILVTFRVTGTPSQNVVACTSVPAAACTGNTSTASATMTPANLVLLKDAPVSSVLPGATFLYTLSVTNNENSDLEGVQLTDALPPGVTVSSVDQPIPSTVSITPTSVSITPQVPLPNGPTPTTVWTLHAKLDLSATQPFTNKATVTALSAPPKSSSKTLQIATGPPPLLITKTASAASVKIGDTVGYAITVLPSSPQPGPIVLTDPLDPSLKLGSVVVNSQTVSTCGPQSSTVGAFSVTCGTDNKLTVTLPAGQTLSPPPSPSMTPPLIVNLVATVQKTAPPNLTNVATVTDANGNAQQSTATVAVEGVSANAASLTITAGKTLAEKGDLVPFVVTVAVPQGAQPIATPMLVLQSTAGLRIGDVKLVGPNGAPMLARPVELNGALQLPLQALPAGTTTSLTVRARVSDRARVGVETLAAQLSTENGLVAGAAAKVRVLADPEFDLGTLLGDVYRDENGNGVRDRGERGIEGAQVVMDDGLMAVTDAEGRYHLAAIRPGDRAIKLARHTLPPGASFTTDETRVVLVTPGSLVKVDFGVKVPALEAPLPRPRVGPSPLPELRLSDADLLRYRLAGQAAPGARVLVDGKEAQFDRKTGAWTAEVRLAHGRNLFTQVTAWPDGRVVVSSRAVFWVERAEGGSLIVPRDEEPRLVLQFPPSALAEPSFTLEGKVLFPLASLTVAGQKLGADASGRVAVKLRFPEEGGGIAVDARFTDGLGARFDHVQSAGGDFFFLVGIAEGKTGYVQRDGTATQNGSSGLFAEGRVKLYAKGRIQGRWLLEGGLDIDSTAINDWRDLFRGDPSRVFRNLDPDRFYPVYGDASQTSAQAQTRGRLYVRIQVDRSELLFGNLQTGLTGVEYGRYSRAVTGGRISYVRAAVDDPRGPPTTEVIAFGAWLQTARAHDELRGTGGSLYYLSHRSVVEGSEQVRVEVRDKISDRPVANVAQRAGADYEVDYLAGRLVLRDPLSSVSMNPSLIRSGNVDGDRAFLVVDYEYVVDGDVDDGTVGLRATQKLGPVRIGGTVVDEIRSGPSYTLIGADLQIDLQKWGTVVAEYAHSYGTLSQFQRSDDGGLSYANAEGTSQEISTRRQGGAWKAEADLHGWGVVDFHPYARGVDQGYTDTAHAQDAGFVQWGADVAAKLWKLTLRAHYDERRWDQAAYDAAGIAIRDADSNQVFAHETRRDAGGELAGSFGRWGVRLGARTERADDADSSRAGHRTAVGARVDVRIVPRLTLYAAGQYAVEHGGGDGLLARDNSLGALGLVADLGWQTKMTAEGSYGAQGAGGLLSLKTELGPGRVVYGTVTLSQDRDDRLLSTVAAGGRERIVDGHGKPRALLFAEDQFRDGPVGSCVNAYTPSSCDGAGRAHVLATGVDVPLGKRFVFGATFERGQVTGSGTPFSLTPGGGANQPIDRTAGTAYASYGGDRVRAQVKAEVRNDTLQAPPASSLPGLPQNPARTSALQWLASGLATLRPHKDFTIRLKALYSRAVDAASSSLARSAEITSGFAWRPSFTDRVALLGRYTFLDEFSPLGQAQNGAIDPVSGRPLALRERSQVMSLATDGRLFWRISLGEKIAAKYKEEPVEGTSDWFILWVNRVSLHVTRRWDAVVEYRLLTIPGKTLTHGVSLEANVIVVGHLRLGAGWNFADFSDNELTLGRGSEKGFFIRAEGFY